MIADIANYISTHSAQLGTQITAHIGISLFALIVAVVIGVPCGYFASKSAKSEAMVTAPFEILRVVPSLALFALLIPVTGLGRTTAVIVLTLYNQYILLRSFTAGLRDVDPAVCEAAKGIGMTDMQILTKIRVPLARRAIFAGIRLAVVSTIGIGTIAASINAGGLGTLLFEGLRTINTPKILWGSVLSALLAVSINRLLKMVEERL